MISRGTQRLRLAELTTPLGTDTLLLTSFTVNEGLSQLFEIDVDCVSHDAEIDFGAAVGKTCSIRLTTVANKTRYFSGVLSNASWFGERDGDFAYRLTLRPWLWILTRTSDCRIFQNQSVLEIIKTVFDDLGFKDYEIQACESYPTLEYCVQYRESSYHFVTRLMERFGLYFYFKFEESKHTLIIGDSKGSHQAIENLPECRFIGMGERTRDDEEYLNSWLISRSFQSGKVTLNGYDFASPKASMRHLQTAQGGYERDDLELYDYPATYKASNREDLGAKFAQAQLYAAQSQDKRREAAGNAPNLFPGGLVTMTKHPVKAENAEFLVVSASHAFVAEQYRSGDGGDGSSYSGSYVLQPSDQPYKSRSVTPAPVIAGPQTAIVVGPSGEEIHTDKHGRIKVQFHWDRVGKNDEKSSRWVRVAQNWAGKSWGGIVIPRIGMEVVVEFIEGDPDRPIVVGSVYNADNPVPFALPDNKTQSGFKTRSSKSGTDSHYNELVFEDKKGAEFVRFHAEKDLMSTVEDGETRTVKGKNKKSAGETTRGTTIESGDDVLTVSTGDSNTTIGRHQTLTVAENRTATVGNNETISIGTNQSVTVGSTITIEAGAKIVLKVGASTITMTGSSIEIKTPSLTTKSTFTEISADVQITEKAGLITLN